MTCSCLALMPDSTVSLHRCKFTFNCSQWNSEDYRHLFGGNVCGGSNQRRIIGTGTLVHSFGSTNCPCDSGAELDLAGNNETFEVTQNMNAYDARVYDVEAAFQRDFGFIAPSLRCLGFYGNYTYTHSTTRNYNTRLGIEDGDDVKMAGSPEHTANASIKINL